MTEEKEALKELKASKTLQSVKELAEQGETYLDDMKEIVEMDRRFRSLETIYNSAYSALVNLEKDLNSLK